MRSFARLLIIAVLIIGGGLGIFKFLLQPYVLHSNANNQLSTQTLFAASFTDAQGQQQALSQWQGKIVIVNFWATWCPPCLEEMPELSNTQKAFKDNGVVVLGISVDDVEKISEFVKETPVSYPLFAADMDAMRLAESLGNRSGVLPYTVVINTDGSIVKSYMGRINQAILQQTLLPLLSPAKL